MKKLLLNFDHKLRKVEYYLALFAGVIVLLLMANITIDVLLRTVFNSGIPGTYEMVTLSFVGVVFLGVPYVQSIKGNINIDILTRIFPNSIQRALDIIGCTLGLFIILILTWQTGLEAWKSFVSQDYTMGVVQFPYWPSKLTIVVGLLFLSIRLFVDSLLYLFKLDEINSEHTENEINL